MTYHVEGHDMLKRDLASLVSFHQDLVDAHRARTGWEPQHKGMLLCGMEVLDPLDNVVGDVGTGLVGVVTDD